MCQNLGFFLNVFSMFWGAEDPSPAFQVWYTMVPWSGFCCACLRGSWPMWLVPWCHGRPECCSTVAPKRWIFVKSIYITYLHIYIWAIYIFTYIYCKTDIGGNSFGHYRYFSNLLHFFVGCFFLHIDLHSTALGHRPQIGHSPCPSWPPRAHPGSRRFQTSLCWQPGSVAGEKSTVGGS